MTSTTGARSRTSPADGPPEREGPEQRVRGEGRSEEGRDEISADVLIVGAGPTGLALALDLTRRGVRCLVAEREERLFPGSRGKGIQPRTQEILYDFGVLPAIHASGSLYPPMRLWEAGRPVKTWQMVELSQDSEQVPHANAWLIPQARTQEVLFRRLKELGGRVHFGRAVTILAQDDSGVTARLGDGRTVRASYAVAADGGRSSVRQGLGIGMTGETVDPRPLLVADVELAPEAPLDRDHWHVWQGEDGGGMSMCPLPGPGNVFQILVQYPEVDSIPDASAEGVLKLVDHRTHLSASAVDEVLWASEFRAKAALAERFRQGRIFLAGDAAHVHSPAGGQGLNTSIQDVYNLGWKLAAVLRDGAPENLLDTYEEERLPIAAEMLGLSTRIHRTTVAKGGATTVQRGPEVQQLGLGYGDSSLSVETREHTGPGGVRVGDRAPDGRPGGNRLFDLFRGTHWSLLAIGTDVPLPELDHRIVRTHRLPPYEAYGTGVFLVRPDGYVGWAGESAEGVKDYLEAVLTG
ncbi:FAD-dependent monooxygenase [Streptomyces sp. NA04227]|uniref:FAD-dependent monooxygenase n=1 Tax=Streptomyces sp. NA04227 TaxID=2742136 RepID=UPI00158FCF78|nr:FAD-dependent monooxygenase [Streptomyces sp. NA04227]QKW08780.1 FAD-dependent monooxygenase [Streptomyces sp. NA04227]